MARTKNTEAPAPAETTLTTDEKIEELPGATFSGVADAVLNEAVEGYRWESRMTRAAVTKEALLEWADKRDLMPAARARLVEQVENGESADDTE